MCSIAAALTISLAAPKLGVAGDWPQILGPHRNCVADGETLAGSWPADGPRTVWKMDVGSGYAGLAVAAGRAVLFERLKNEEVAVALDAKTGEVLWRRAFPTRYTSGIAPDDGPRCTPLIYKDHIYLLGAMGDLHCLAMADGAEHWSRGLAKDFGAPEGYFGAGSTPIIVADRLLVNVGGRSGSGLVALALADGKTLWNASDEQASYSSPTVATVDGVEHTIFVTRLNAVSIDAATGNERFRFPFGKRGPTVNAATPLVFDGYLFVSASYGVGAALAKIGKNDAKIIWKNDGVMSSQYTTCVYYDGHLYGIDGRQDEGVGRLRCVEPKTAKILWTEENFGTGNLILARDKLLIMKTDGHLLLIAPSPEKFQKLAEAPIFETTVQPLPALSNGLLYVRDTKTLKCLQVGEGK